MFKGLDAYTVKARYYPAMLATIPGLAALAILISWSKFGLTTVVASAAIPMLIYASADIARRLGKRIEDEIYRKAGGKPSVTMLRYGDSTLDTESKAEYRKFLSTKINRPVPTEDQEKVDPTAGDTFYERGGAWLRENTRNVKKFGVLFAENITYGFRRNLFGLKWPALALNIVLVALCGFFLYRQMPIDTENDTTLRLLVVVVLAFIHSLYMLFGVSRQSVINAGRMYARQLILSCETFLGKDPPKPRTTKAKTT